MRLNALIGKLGLLRLSLAAFFALVLFYASVMEDAYITFRVVDNFVHGYGLVWNLDERVQVYTHPLWMLLHIPFYAVFGHVFWMSIVLSLVCTAGMFWLVWRTFEPTQQNMVCLFVLPLMVCHCFILFSTSGFENALSHVLFAWFGYVLWRPAGKYTWFLLSLATALSLLNRLDIAVMFAPVWCYLLWEYRREVVWKQLLAGALPLVLWEMFSLWYYGFLFPNTKYAKLGTGISELEYLRLGVAYMFNLLVTDSYAALLLLVGVALLGWLCVQYQRKKDERTGLLAALAAGALVYSLYVVYVGGTYITGRMVTLQLLVVAWLMLAMADTLPLVRWLKRWAVVLVAFAFLYPPVATVRQICPQLCFTGVWPQSKQDIVNVRDVLSGSQRVPVSESIVRDDRIVVAGSLGQWGFEMPRRVIILDHIALADVLLARLPANRPSLYSMGTLFRDVPAGYLHARATGDLAPMELHLAKYYEKLRIITMGDVWSAERLQEIVRFNLGEYEDLREAYLATLTPPFKP